jgi:glutathionylspermidine synthase
MNKCATMPEVNADPWYIGDTMPAEQYRHVLRRAIFDCCKWHTQVEDRPVLCPFPLVLDRCVWKQLALWAEQLARETLAAEEELRQRPDLHAELGLPRALRRPLRHAASAARTDRDVRVMRFDFHWTTEGWRISEANTDVAGGYIEASGVTALIAECYPGCRPTGDPAAALGTAIRYRVGTGGTVGLMHLTVYVEDRQIILYLARRLQELGLVAIPFDPTQLCVRGGRVFIHGAEEAGALDLVFRFFPAEWLPHLPRRTGWTHLLDGRVVSMCNPVHAVLSQSKRFPLVWDRLATALPTWRMLLPETRGACRWGRRDLDGWVVKPALGHEGHNIGIAGVTDDRDWQHIRRWSWWNPAAWAVQRRFTPRPLPSPEGLMYPCLGIYVIDGQAAGAFGRVAPFPLIDDRSREIVVLLAPPTEHAIDAT